MIIFFPWHTDAPIYHWPFATVGLIVVTTLAFLFTGPPDLRPQHPDFQTVEHVGPQEEMPQQQAQAEEDEDVEVKPNLSSPWVLSHGNGLHPIQWVGSNFAHGNIFHLIGNMIFLWSFGIVVEGKLGWWRFLLLYLGLGTLQCASEQLVMLGAEQTASFGASAIIYGLLAMCLVWAPKNDLYCIGILWVGFRLFVRDFEIPIIMYATFYLVLEAITVFFSGFAMNSALLHVSGAAWGFVVGTALLKLRLVDCEGWDLFSYRKGTHIRREPKAEELLKERAQRELELAEKAEARFAARSTALLEQLRAAVTEGHAAAALALYQKIDEGRGAWTPPEADLLALIKLLHKSDRWVESIPLMDQYVHRFPKAAAKMRLKLAQLLVQEQRPMRALRILADIPAGAITDPALIQARHHLERKAKSLCEEGVIEVEE